MLADVKLTGPWETTMFAVLVILVPIVVLVGFDLLAVRFGADSRDTFGDERARRDGPLTVDRRNES